jgi:hypothetical protein
MVRTVAYLFLALLAGIGAGAGRSWTEDKYRYLASQSRNALYFGIIVGYFLALLALVIVLLPRIEVLAAALVGYAHGRITTREHLEELRKPNDQ